MSNAATDEAEGADGNLRQGLRQRFVGAQRRLEDLLGRRMSMAALGRRIGYFAGRTEFRVKVVKGWLEANQEPKLRMKITIARALDVDPGWLWFGSESQAPAPKDAERSLVRRDELWSPEGSRRPLEMGSAIPLEAEDVSDRAAKKAVGVRAGQPGHPRQGGRGGRR